MISKEEYKSAATNADHKERVSYFGNKFFNDKVVDNLLIATNSDTSDNDKKINSLNVKKIFY